MVLRVGHWSDYLFRGLSYIRPGCCDDTSLVTGELREVQDFAEQRQVREDLREHARAELIATF